MKKPDPVDIVKFWHRVEFFVPYNLSDAKDAKNAKDQEYSISQSKLEQRLDQVLPWLSPKTKVKDEYTVVYTLYLKPFEINALTRISKEVFPVPDDPIKSTEFEEKLDDDGLTCFATLNVDINGRPDFGSLSLSTLPWALGKLQKRKIGDLSDVGFSDSRIMLDAEIRSLASNLPEGVLDVSSLLLLNDILEAWADFDSKYPIALYIKTKLAMLPKTQSEDGILKAIQESSRKQMAAEVEFPKMSNEEVEEEDNKDDNDNILNSFFISDLEKVVNCLQKGECNPVSSYIEGLSASRMINLDDKHNAGFIVDNLRPDKMNRGRWPSSGDHYMNLMQQFAINEFFHPKNTGNILSVNGPPGTGKTTLLREIIAENIVRRAEVLASFTDASEAFEGEISVNFTGRESRQVQILSKKLTGFEMVLASYNNAAVENISRELPLLGNISDEYASVAQYMTPVINKVFAKHKNGTVLPLDNLHETWGLIAAALGKSENKFTFVQSFFFAPENRDLPEGNNNYEKRIQAGKYLTIWEWRKLYKGPSFKEAQEAFLAAEKELYAYMHKIKRIEELWDKIENHALNKDIEMLKIEKAALIKQELGIKYKETDYIKKLSEIRIKIDKVNADMLAYHKIRPSILATILRLEYAKKYEKRRSAMEDELDALSTDEKSCSKALSEAKQELMANKASVINIEKRILELEAEKNLLGQEFARMKYDMSGIVLPPSDNDYQKQDLQMKAPWQDEQLNKLRSMLFIRALKLHEAWLASVLRNNTFNSSLLAISDLLSNKKIVNHAYEQYIWQLVFMIIPVISCTFASFARQFARWEKNSIGCLIIDEAGQVAPQAAVGALWRAKKAIVVGDPLQIEPVFTVPANLVEGLAKYFLRGSYTKWLPTIASVQSLADQANIFGVYTTINEQQHWIGCQLIIHRRCIDPMFIVANDIAYSGKMINARKKYPKSNKHYFWGESAWFNITGIASDKQYVVEQGQFVHKMIVSFYAKKLKLPKIYIITPFKRVKLRLRELLSDVNDFAILADGVRTLPSQHNLDSWCAQHIGTVHTFQGKEADAVILVLGADNKNLGAVAWASGKPNLLNVAVTRARDRLYVVGDCALWGDRSYFSKLAQGINIINASNVRVEDLVA